MKVTKDTKASRRLVVFPGNSFVEKNVFAAFETVVIHPVSPKHLVDFTTRLTNLDDDLKKVVTSPTRTLVAYGEAIRCLAPQLLYIPQQQGILYNDTTVSPAIIHDVSALNYIPFYADIYAEASLRDTFYNRNLRYASSIHEPMYAFSQDVVWNSTGKHTGTIYTVTPQKIAVCETPPSAIDGDIPKELPSIQALYAEDFDKDGNRIRNTKNEDAEIEDISDEIDME